MYPNFYCRAWQHKKKASLKMHRQHCRSVRNIVLPARRDFMPFSDAETDMFNPENRCAKCDERIGAQSHIIQHLKRKYIICRSDKKA